MPHPPTEAAVFTSSSEKIPWKLEFVLCDKCATDKNQFSCNHSDLERCLLRTWATVEVSKAIEEGYKIIEIYEVLHFENKSDKMFTNYINLWLEEKLKSSGFPSSTKTAKEKQKYIEEYMRK